MHLVTLVLLTLGAVALTLTVATHLAVWRVLARPITGGEQPPISVLKPVKGADADLYDNLVAFARQRYSRFELVIGAADRDDPALEVAERFARAHPLLHVTIVRGAPDFGMNPKVQVLRVLASRARHRHLLISDAGVRPGPDYLADLAAAMSQPGVGLVSSVLGGTGARGAGGIVENLHLNGFVAGAVCGAEVFARRPCVVGKSMLFRRDELLALGGFELVKDVLAEDYVLGAAFRAAGHRVALSGHVLPVMHGCWRLKDFVRRHLRWSQMRRWQSPTYFAEPLLAPSPLLGSALVAALAGGERPLVAAAAAGLALELASVLVLDARLRRGRLHLAHAPYVMVKDVLVLGLWAGGLVLRTVDWKGKAMRIGRGSVLTEARQPARSVAQLGLGRAA